MTAFPSLAGQPDVGEKTAKVSEAYSQAFLKAILPQLSDFVAKVGLDITLPITTNRIILSNYVCRLLHGQPIAQLYLTNGDRFNYEQGHVKAFYAHDAMDKFPETGRTEDFLGQIKISTDAAIALCEGVMKKLGDKDKLPQPTISYAPRRGTLDCTRYIYYWTRPGEDFEFAHFEVDMENKTIKSVYLDAAPFRHEPPKIDAPAGTHSRQNNFLIPVNRTLIGDISPACRDGLHHCGLNPRGTPVYRLVQV